MNNAIILSIQNGEPLVSSRDIAENFGKEHKSVLRSIEELVAQNCAAKPMFHESTFENRGKQYPMYLMNRDGFSLLVMGFTGKAALEWKLKYIAAFNEMEKRLAQKQQDALEGLSPQLQYLIKLEQEQNRQAQELAQVNERLDAACEAFSVTAGADWKKVCSNAISAIAMKRGGGSEAFESVWNEIYAAVDSRGFRLEQRVINMQKNAMLRGSSKTAIRKISKLDAIELSGSRSLICAFVDAVREKAAAQGVRIDKLNALAAKNRTTTAGRLTEETSRFQTFSPD